jgi:predicted nucleic acid-binding protein
MKQPLERPLKLYLDTSIPNFLFAEDDREKRKVTEKLFALLSHKTFEFYVSGVVLREIEKAPTAKRELLVDCLKQVEILEFTPACEHLALAYVQTGALPKSSIEDARHVAVATVHNLDAVISWNFKHLVNLRRVKSINLINEGMGYKHIEIMSPHEVIEP